MDFQEALGRRLASWFRGSKSGQVLVGTLTGVLIIVFAVATSTLAFGSYGWGLFVLTPLVVGLATGYLVNRFQPITARRTNGLVLLSAALGCFALIIFALEGLICLILASPLAALLAIAGGALGRAAARKGSDGPKPLFCVALLPFAFAADAVSPPSVNLLSEASIDIAAPQERVWAEIISNSPIAASPPLAGRLGLAYPMRGELVGGGRGAARYGRFSTGTAIERVTEWRPGYRLTFEVLSQPPAMKETSPYRHVHAPHVQGYFETGETQFDLKPLSPRTTRLTIRAAHRLKIDPIIYWEPIARWAIRENTRRVLRDIAVRSESQG